MRKINEILYHVIEVTANQNTEKKPLYIPEAVQNYTQPSHHAPRECRIALIELATFLLHDIN